MEAVGLVEVVGSAMDRFCSERHPREISLNCYACSGSDGKVARVRGRREAFSCTTGVVPLAYFYTSTAGLTRVAGVHKFPRKPGDEVGLAPPHLALQAGRFQHLKFDVMRVNRSVLE